MLKNLSLLQIILLATGIIVVVILAVDHQQKESPETVAVKAAQEARWETDLGGAVTLRKRMRDPDSFKVSQVIEMPDGSVCYEYRARNGFGGMDGGRAVVFQDHLVDEETLGFKDTYAAECAGKTGVEKAPEINEALRMVAGQQ